MIGKIITIKIHSVLYIFHTILLLLLKAFLHSLTKPLDLYMGQEAPQNRQNMHTLEQRHRGAALPNCQFYY